MWGSMAFFATPPRQPLPCLDPQSCPMLTWPFPFTPYGYLEFPHHTPCSPCIHSLIMPHVHLSIIHPSCPFTCAQYFQNEQCGDMPMPILRATAFGTYSSVTKFAVFPTEGVLYWDASWWSNLLRALALPPGVGVGP